MKNNKIILKIFQIFGIIFAGVSLYEGIKFIAPYYSYGKFLILSAIIGLLYLIYSGNISYRNLKQVSSYRGIKQIIPEKSDNPFISSLRFFENKKEYIVYGGFIIVFLVAVLSIIFGYEKIFSFIAGTYIFIYLFAKILGFSFDFSIQKYSLKDSNALRFFTLVFAVFLVCIGALLSESFIPETERGWYYILAGLGYILGVGIIFFNLSFPKIKIFTPYNILSMILITCLSGVLLYKNFSTGEEEYEGIVEEKNEITVEPEPDYIEAVVSDEAELIPEEISVEVSEKYDLTPGMLIGSSGENVSNLQKVLALLGVEELEADGIYDEATRVGLRNTLIEKCDWPESTKGTFGPLAKECIDNLEITIPKEN